MFWPITELGAVTRPRPHTTTKTAATMANIIAQLDLMSFQRA